MERLAITYLASAAIYVAVISRFDLAKATRGALAISTTTRMICDVPGDRDTLALYAIHRARTLSPSAGRRRALMTLAFVRTDPRRLHPLLAVVVFANFGYRAIASLAVIATVLVALVVVVTATSATGPDGHDHVRR